MVAADILSKDHHLRAMATMRVLPYVPFSHHPPQKIPPCFFLFFSFFSNCPFLGPFVFVAWVPPPTRIDQGVRMDKQRR